jgi:serine/threonine-protein kinase RsbW
MCKAAIHKTLTITSSHAKICEVCNVLLGDLKSCNFSADDVFGIHLAVEEALINAVKHGNKAVEGKKVTVDYAVGDEGFEITVVDEGSGFDPKGVPDPRKDENLLKASGRGLLLMKSYMDHVEYTAKGNGVHMVKHRIAVK